MIIVIRARSNLKNRVENSHYIINQVLYDIKLWKKNFQSYELTFSLGDELKSWTCDNDDE
jgi:hypothetical protein